ncbi:TIGR03067 domain-containing protein [Gemmata sp. G18]|uniref:TIGR03067 domain-containing protein n=1 Tax=Gemmata palustris TaxID=2822762 RepID=A0ABS5BNZ3_9BACT|nr:TIGR03067 domain-containing protein [Gemmata palustris]MBP3955025.1 TIGR03067 domain-containing protein [Gemmata palustris]
MGTLEQVAKRYPMTALVTFLIFVPLYASATDKAEKLIAEEQKKLQGTWKVVKAEPEELKVKDDYRVTFKGDKVTFGDRPAIKFKLGPMKDPKWFDIYVELEEGGEELFGPGIYKLDGEMLIIATVTESEGAVFKPRPKNFTDRFFGQRLHLERVKK